MRFTLFTLTIPVVAALPQGLHNLDEEAQAGTLVEKVKRWTYSKDHPNGRHWFWTEEELKKNPYIYGDPSEGVPGMQQGKDENSGNETDNAPFITSDDSSKVASDSQKYKPDVNFRSIPFPDVKLLYPQQELTLRIDSWNNGTDEANNLVLQSSELASLNFSITSVEGNCPGTSPGSSKIQCQWKFADPGFKESATIKLRFEGSSSDAVSIILSLVWGQGQSDHKNLTHRWETGNAPTYTQESSVLSRFPQERNITVNAVLDAKEDRERLKQRLQWADFEPTGFYLNPNSPLTVVVSGASPDGPSPELRIGTPALVNPDRPDDTMPAQLMLSGPLANGPNTVSNPLGGIIYIRYAYGVDQSQSQPPPVTVTLDGDAAQPFPFFRDGKTTDAQWGEMLKVTKVPFAEHAGKRVIITGLATSAKKYAQSNRRLLGIYAAGIDIQDKISGLDAAAPEARDRPSPLRPMVVQSKESLGKGIAFAENYYIAIRMNDHNKIWNPEITRSSWTIWHELGHQRQHVKTWSWASLSEVTVNIYTLAVLRELSVGVDDDGNHATAEEWNAAQKYLDQKTPRDFDTAGEFIQLAMFEQLRVAFKDELYYKLHINSRAGPTQATEADKKHYFMVQVSQIVQQNLGQYFAAWGLKPEQRTLDEMNRQPNATEDYTKKAVYQKALTDDSLDSFHPQFVTPDSWTDDSEDDEAK